jgi:hypothetical protein
MDNGEYAPFLDRFFRPRAMVSANACYSLSTVETTVSGADILHLQKRRILYCRNSSRNSRSPVARDTTVPHSARVWNYWLGGTDNYPADQLVGDQVMATIP